MQKLFIPFFNTTYKMTSRLNKTVREVLLFLSCVTLFWIYFFGNISLDKEPKKIMVLGSVITFIIAIFSVNGEVHTIKWNRSIYGSMICFGVGIMFVSLLHPLGSGYLVYAIDLVVVFPALYFVWGNRKDYASLYNIISITIMIAGIMSFVYCFYIARNGELLYHGDRLSAHRTNPNFLGMLGVAMVTAGEYLVLSKRKNRIICFFSAVVIGAGISYVVLSISRTSMLCVIICVITIIVFAYKQIRGTQLNLKLAVSVAAIIIVVVGSYIFGTKLSDIDARAKNASIKSGAETEQRDIQDPEPTGEKIAERVIPNKKKSNYASGRIKIWSIYLKHSSWFGKSFDALEEDIKQAVETRAHNNFVDYAFRYGYIDTFFYLAFFVLIGSRGLILLFDRKHTASINALQVMTIGIYSVSAMLEIASLPFMRILPCMFFLIIAPFMVRNKSA